MLFLPSVLYTGQLSAFLLRRLDNQVLLNSTREVHRHAFWVLSTHSQSYTESSTPHQLTMAYSEPTIPEKPFIVVIWLMAGTQTSLTMICTINIFIQGSPSTSWLLMLNRIVHEVHNFLAAPASRICQTIKPLAPVNHPHTFWHQHWYLRPCWH